MATVKHALRRLLDGLRSLPPRRRRRRDRDGVVVRRSGSVGRTSASSTSYPAAAPPPPVTVRVATFNAAMFSMAPAVPVQQSPAVAAAVTASRPGQRPIRKGILKAAEAQCCPAPSPSSGKKLRVSINIQLDDGEARAAAEERSRKGKAVAVEQAVAMRWSVAGALREVGADIVALQNVRAEEARGMRPLAEVAEAVGMRHYVFAESWAPEYGNAVLSRWPIKRWKSHRVADHSDFRNVLRATIDVPRAGEVNVHCTHLDHLDESWRMKQLDSILRSADGHHILAGGLNALDGTDYSAARWADIAKLQYYEEIGKPAPKAEVMRFLKAKRYVDAKDFAGECEAVVVVAKGQGVQGTCKHGTRVDYILASPGCPYRFVPGSYAVVSSKGTSDHHIVKADVTVAGGGGGGGGRGW